ncbi:ribosomal protein L13 domain-containing protein [Pelagophyceae sp. CCMP2097]|nr:ribosomal protein L13 domain-containing protein [Pelagophyceae sp. CCMP2097]
MVFQAEIVIDGRAHMLGRLASIVAKELLMGQKVVVVRCEQVEISGSIMRNKVKFSSFMKKTSNTNPKRGVVHYRSPSRMIWRCIRGMVPHKTFRGAQAMGRLQCFEGVPAPYDKQKKMVVPSALKVLRIKPGRNTTVIGRLASEFGWAHGELIAKMEQKRNVKSAEFYAAKKSDAKLRAQAAAQCDLSSVLPTLEAFGHHITPKVSA